MTENIQEIYNRLHDFESKAKSKKEKKLYPVHKKLDFKEEKFSDISDWIIENLKINNKDFILDAGCGVGYVLTKICSNFNCSGLGISLSEKEIIYAKDVCRKRGLDKQVSFEQKSFDDELNLKFDIIIAIESVKHSASLENTLGNFANHLKPGGRIFMLDDFATDTGFHFLKKQVKKYWSVHSFYTFSSVKEKLEKLRLPYEVIDFTPNVYYSKKRQTAAKILFMYPFSLLANVFPFLKIYTIYFAGFCLERLYEKKALEYKAIIATKINST